ncbi:MAG: methylenetetrahydrofolate--tRNA-(uracil(54)-C(5))-methyltransferase (FADH(2)-oxidizing) TrmFO [Firmicutes bacterium]|nr:methylenetetrahydrofolate--tRNA-(uracil(54)-C(5))-methyltransferase (FADH(2)-oxidizing) TrmFO [Bacillota bacterium]
METKVVKVVGAGLAGSEAAWQAAKRGLEVHLYEMRPQKKTPAHHTGNFAELVCSNSLRAAALENAVGLLKEEMRRMDSLIMDCADSNRVPAGGALAVDRDGFAGAVTEKLSQHPQVVIHREEISTIPDGLVVLATGPLTSDNMAAGLRTITGEEYLYFYDAVAPIVTLESINKDVAFWSSRYNKGEAAYLNCPMNKEEYEHFVYAMLAAERAPRKGFEQEVNFEGCMPIEVMAARGPDTIRFGPLKPVGLIDPRTGKQPYAVVQLRQDNAQGTLYNMVGFQTHLKWGEQERVFKLIPGLENAEFVRFGVMHRNTYINSPSLLEPTYQCRRQKDLLLAGQMTGVEGYVESAASGLVAGLNASRLAQGKSAVVFPPETAHGALAQYITTANSRHFQPMNITFGLLPALGKKIRDKKQRNKMIADRALAALGVSLEAWEEQVGD